MTISTESRPVGWVNALWMRALLFGFAYFISANLGHWLSSQPQAFVNFWLPSGLYVATLLLNPTRKWPVFALAACAGNIAFDLWHGQKLLLSLLFCAGNSAEALAGAWLVRRFVAARPRLDSAREVLGFITLSALGSTLLSATVGAAAVAQFADGTFGQVWPLWWSGDMTGVMVLAPLLLTWQSGAGGLFAECKTRRCMLEAFAVVVCVCLSAWFAIDMELQAGIGLKYLVWPFVGWAAMRFGVRGVAVTVPIVALAFGWQVSHIEPADAARALPVFMPTVVMQVFVFVTATTGLLLAAALAERRRRELQLREQTVVMDQASDTITITDLEGNIRYVNEVQCRVIGRTREELIGKSVEIFGDDPARGATQREMIKTTLAAGEWRGEVVNRAADGRELIVECRTWLVRDEQGQPVGMCGVGTDITGRKQSEEALRRAAHEWQTTFDTSSDAIWVLDQNQRIVRSNRAAEKCFARPGAEMIGRYCWEVAHGTTEPLPNCPIQRSRRSLRRETMELPMGERWFEVTVDPILDDGKFAGAVHVVSDITERKQAELRIQHLNRVYALLSDINQTIVRVLDPQELFTEACRIAVEKGGFRMAWIGLVDRSAKRVKVAAQAGVAGDYLEKLSSIMADPALCQGLIANNLESGEHRVCNDITNDSRMALLREDALRMGYRALAAFPLVVAGHTAGVFNLYADEAGFFDAEELRLLDELATDISFALEVHQRETERHRAELALRESELRFQDLYENAPDMHLSVDAATGNVVQCNQTLVQVTGFSKDEIVGRPVFELHHSDCQPAARRLFDSFLATGSVRDAELQVRRKAGSRLDVSINVSAVRDGQGRIRLTRSVWRDITERKRAEQTLREVKERLELTQNAAGLGAWDWDIPTGRIEWSPKMFELFGLDPVAASASFETWRAALHPEDGPAAERRIEQALQTGADLGNEYRVVRPDGQVRWINALGKGFYDTQGRPVRMSGICIDITERKRADQALRESRERLQSIFRAAPAGIGLVVNRVFKEVNAQLCAMTGYSAEELIGASSRVLYPSDEDFLYVGREKYRQIAEHGTGTVETRWQRKDGAIIEVLLSSTPLDGSDLERGVTFTALDITGRKRTEAALRASEHKFRALTQQMPDFVWQKDADSVYVSCNKHYADTLGLTPETIAGRRDEDFYPAELAAKRRADDQQVIASGQPLETEEQWRQGQDSRWLHTHKVPLLDEQGRCIGTIGIGRDITDRRQAEQALRESETRYRQMLRSVTDYIYRVEYDEGRPRSTTHGPGCEGVTGYQPEDYATNPYLWFLMVHPEDRVAVEQNARRILRGESSEPLEHRILHKDGSVRWVRNTLLPRRDAAGQLVACDGMITDITERKRAEEALRFSEQKFAKAFVASPEAITITSVAGGHYLDVNEVFLKITGFQRDEVVGHTAAELKVWVEPSDRERFLTQLRANGRVHDFETRYRMRSGEIRQFQVSTETIEINRESCYLHFIQDITERKESERALARDEAELSAIYEHAPVIMCLLGSNGSVRRLNRAALEFAGGTNDDAAGKGPGDFMSCLEALKAPEGCGFAPACAACPLRVALLDTVQHGTTHRRVESWLHLRRKGQAQDMAVLASTARVDVSGESLVLLCLEDITGQKEAEARILQQAALLDQTQDAVLVAGLDKRLRYCNHSAEQFFGVPAGQLLNQSVETLIFSGAPENCAEACRTTLEKGSWSGETNATANMGNRALSSRWTLIRDAANRPASFLIVNTDVTEHKRLEEQLLRSQRMESIGTLASGVAHDLNNILAPIMIATEVLQPLARGQDEEEVIELLRKGAQRGADIVRQLLMFGRGAQGQRLDLQPRTLLKEMMKVMQETFPKAIRLEHNFPENLWTIHADPTQVHQVLLNLCVNARDAMPHGGRLSLSAENLVIDEQYAAINLEAKAGPYIVLDVGDTGTGIPPEILQKIFDPFFTTKEQGKGTGLGLSTVLGIMKGHEGFTQVSSRVGEGSHFKVYFPALKSQRDSHAAKFVARPPKGAGELILVVDDEEAIRTVAQRMLIKFGYRVITAADGAEGLVLFSRHKTEFSAAVVDMVMPVMDGAALIRSLRHLSPELRIIAMSGLMTQREDAEKAGMTEGAFLIKPFETDALLVLLHKVLAGSKAG